jgi:hypothetical protein
MIREVNSMDGERVSQLETGEVSQLLNKKAEPQRGSAAVFHFRVNYWETIAFRSVGYRICCLLLKLCRYQILQPAYLLMPVLQLLM